MIAKATGLKDITREVVIEIFIKAESLLGCALSGPASCLFYFRHIIDQFAKYGTEQMEN